MRRILIAGDPSPAKTPLNAILVTHGDRLFAEVMANASPDLQILQDDLDIHIHLLVQTVLTYCNNQSDPVVPSEIWQAVIGTKILPEASPRVYANLKLAIDQWRAEHSRPKVSLELDAKTSPQQRAVQQQMQHKARGYLKIINHFIDTRDLRVAELIQDPAERLLRFQKNDRQI